MDNLEHGQQSIKDLRRSHGPKDSRWRSTTLRPVNLTALNWPQDGTRHSVL